MRVHALVLTEDSGGVGARTWAALLPRMGRCVRPDREIVPDPANDAAVRRACAGNAWKARKPDAVQQADLRALLRTLLGTLSRGELVVFHVDADVPWSRREECPHLDPFERVIRARIGASDRLVLALPHAMIESWLYLHHERLDPAARERVEAWLAEPGALDEVEHIKDKSFPPNDRLAEGFPCARARERSPSFAATLDLLARALDAVG